MTPSVRLCLGTAALRLPPSGVAASPNPFANPRTLRLHAPPFDKIRQRYQPRLYRRHEAAIAESRRSRTASEARPSQHYVASKVRA